MNRKPPQWAQDLFQKMDQRMDRFEAKMDVMDLEIRSLGVGLEEVRDDVKLLAEGQIDIHRKLDEHSVILEQHTEMIWKLQAQMNIANRKLDDHDSKIDELTAEVGRVNDKLDDHDRKIDGLVAGMGDISRKLDRKVDRSEFIAVESRVAQLEAL